MSKGLVALPAREPLRAGALVVIRLELVERRTPAARAELVARETLAAKAELLAPETLAARAVRAAPATLGPPVTPRLTTSSQLST